MGHDISLLPEALPDDAEDVAWGLQTATALWNRGELKEALVWLRRAAEAATSAGQDARGTTLSKNAADLEQWMTPPARPVDPLAQTGPAPAPSASIPPPKPPPPRQAVIEIEPDLIEEETNDMRELPGIAAAVVNSLAVPTISQAVPTVEPPPQATPTDGELASSKAAATDLVVSSTPSVRPSRPPPQAPLPSATIPAPAAAVELDANLGMRTEAKTASKLGGLAGDLPREGRKVDERKDAATPTPAQVVAAAKPASSVAIHEATSEEEERVERAAQKKRQRAPILDPWSDELPASDAPRTVLQRSDAQGPDDSDVITSAPPLDVTLKRKPPPPPPKRSGTFPGAMGTTLATVPDSPESKRAGEVQLHAAPASAGDSQTTAPPASANGAHASASSATAPASTPMSAASVGASDLPPQTSGARPPPPRRPTIQPRASSAPAGEDRKSVPPPPPVARDERDSPPPTMPAAQRKPTMQPRVPPPPPLMRSTHPSAPNDGTPTSQRASSPSIAPQAASEPRPTLAPSPGQPAPSTPLPSTPQPSPITEPSNERPLAATLVTEPARIPTGEPEAARPAIPLEPAALPAAESTAEQPAAEQSTAEQPAAEQPAAEQPAAEQPAAEPEQPAQATREDEPPAIMLGALLLDTVEGFADLPRPALAALRDAATTVELGAEEEASSTGILLVLDGDAVVCATVSDAAARHLTAGALASSISTRSDATRTRVVAITSAKLAVWDRAALEDILKSAPWAIEELAKSGDRLAAFAGSTMGPLGDLDEGSRMAAFERMTAKTLKPGESFVAAGSELPGLTVVGSGALVLTDGREFETGDVVLPEFALEGGELPWDITAGNDGAIVLSANRMGTVELFSVLPSLLELLRIV